LVRVGGILVAPTALRVPFIAGFSLLSLAVLGALGGRLGGASRVKGAVRVTIGGALAMGVTAAIGHFLGV
jgi:VIT1/CCC1 family predicted Fe2+/Mn2+ transporter